MAVTAYVEASLQGCTRGEDQLDDGRMQQGVGGEAGCSALSEPLNEDLIRRCLAVGPWDHNGKPLWHRLLDWAVDAGAPISPADCRASTSGEAPAARPVLSSSA